MLQHAWVAVVVAGLLAGVGGCERGEKAGGKNVTVFAAASLAEPLKELKAQFETANPGTRVNYSLGGSNQLRSQLEQGAPADVFASANTKEMDAAVKAGAMEAGSVRIFVRNRLVVIFPKTNPAKIAGLADLARVKVAIDVADPAVPVGKYTLAMLEAMAKDPAYGPGFKAGFLANVKSHEENVKAVVNKVRLGEMDAGVVYASDVSGEARQDLASLAVPEPFNQLAEYPIGVTRRAAEPALARKFVELVLSPPGQEILARYGFIAVGPGQP